MKRYILLPLLAATFAAQAQDSYMNERLTNNSSDVIGTARYVGMGGALGALGADMSVISWNPAGIGLYRKNDIALTFGGTWGKSRIDEVDRGKATFDQAGFVYNIRTGSESCPYVNFAFNFQKKINFNHNFYADNPELRGLSQMDQVAELVDWDEGWQHNLAGLAFENNYFSSALNEDGNRFYYNDIPSISNYYTHHSEGSLQAFDFNLSTNINDRAFIGLTVGVDNMLYRSWNIYGEYDLNGVESYNLHNDIDISGTGVNVKLGTIIRPFEDSPFRFGAAIETPTWYRLRNSTFFFLRDCISGQESKELESYLKFNVRSPWKFRASIGSTVGSVLAWDVDYEYATYGNNSISYPGTGGIKDVEMNNLTRQNMRGTHTLRVGLEANATKNLAFRLGYNLSTSAYKKNINFDQYWLCSDADNAMDYATSTSFMRLGTANILTLGMGYHSKSFYIDLAYKLRNQFADFYAFDTSFAQEGSNSQFTAMDMNKSLIGATIDPVEVNLTRHAITCSLGFKF